MPDQQNRLGQIVLAQRRRAGWSALCFRCAPGRHRNLQQPEGSNGDTWRSRARHSSGSATASTASLATSPWWRGSTSGKTPSTGSIFPEQRPVEHRQDANDLCFQDPRLPPGMGFWSGMDKTHGLYRHRTALINGALLRHPAAAVWRRIDIPDGLSLIWLGLCWPSTAHRMKPVERLKPYTEPPGCRPPAPADAGQSVYVQYHRHPAAAEHDAGWIGRPPADAGATHARLFAAGPFADHGAAHGDDGAVYEPWRRHLVMVGIGGGGDLLVHREPPAITRKVAAGRRPAPVRMPAVLCGNEEKLIIERNRSGSACCTTISSQECQFAAL